jgi:hypothetical protein
LQLHNEIDIEKLEGKYILHKCDFVKIEDVSAVYGNYTYLGHRRNITLHFTHVDEYDSKSFIEGYDEIKTFNEVDLKAKVHRFMAMLSLSESSYLMGSFYRKIRFKENGNFIDITAERYNEDGNFNIRELEREISMSVPKRIIEGSKEDIEIFLKKRK